MIVDKKIIKLRGEPYAVLLHRDDYTGHDRIMVRKVKKIEGLGVTSYVVKTPDGGVDVTGDMFRYETDQADVEKHRRWYHETHYNP